MKVHFEDVGLRELELLAVRVGEMGFVRPHQPSPEAIQSYTKHSVTLFRLGVDHIDYCESKIVKT